MLRNLALDTPILKTRFYDVFELEQSGNGHNERLLINQRAKSQANQQLKRPNKFTALDLTLDNEDDSIVLANLSAASDEYGDGARAMKLEDFVMEHARMDYEDEAEAVDSAAASGAISAIVRATQSETKAEVALERADAMSQLMPMLSRGEQDRLEDATQRAAAAVSLERRVHAAAALAPSASPPPSLDQWLNNERYRLEEVEAKRKSDREGRAALQAAAIERRRQASDAAAQASSSVAALQLASSSGAAQQQQQQQQ